MAPETAPGAPESGTAALPALEVPTLSRRATAGDVVRRALAASTARLVEHDPVVRRGEDIEGVHQARVATRRLRSDLRSFAPLVDTAWADRLRAELRELADQLGAVRDADVLLERLREDAAKLDQNDRAAVERVLRHLDTARRRDRAALLATMDAPRYATLLEDLVDAAQHPVLSAAAERPASRELRAIAARPWKRLRRGVAGLGEQPADEELHAVRIMAKRARYATEAVAVVIPDAAAFAKAVARLQTVLGDHHDAVIAEQWLRAAPTRTRQEAYAVGVLAGLQREAAAASRAAWPDAWAAARRPRLRTWM